VTSASKPRKRGRRSRERAKARAARARQTRVQQERAEKRKLTPRQYARRRALGWSLVATGVTVGVLHWLQHLEVFTAFPSVFSDLGLGYPLAGLLGILGAIRLSTA
jgi:hypothetical protein